MARTSVTLTTTFQQVAAGKMVMSVKEGVGELIIYNDVSSDTAAGCEVLERLTQIQQTEDKPTFAKTDARGVLAKVIVNIDEEG